ncbi:MAG: YciI family protein [Pseudomonadota bacterium]|nr:YciI family protein [Pseudomonadota bacterium]
MIGSLIVIDVDNKEAAELWSKNDPYKKADLFQRTEIFKFKHLI